ncbi:metalloprotease [Devosia pacifica]|uniref:Metalloprotease n=1 Tax=Devosia pacifica TaxID=1335967 RepID=A0A918VVF2_9HYPH|nr:M48 family metalloprotease [Devosia pacifica]GHA26567.1 metalloprotease [Devosia pacifica]
MALALAIATLSGCTGLSGGQVTVTRTGDNPAPTVVPPGTEPNDEVIGRREHPRILASYGGVYSDRKAEIMIARIVSRLLASADQPNAQFQVTVLDSPEVNAFALPGGYIYVTRGLLALASDTSELAAVLSHEIAHVTLRHARARTDRTRTNAIVDRVMTAIFGEDDETTSGRSQVSMAAFSRQQELEADSEGIKIAGKAGYDPHAAARFLGVMSRFARFSSGSATSGDDFLSSHPSTPERISKAVERARALFGAPDSNQAAGRSDYLSAIDGLTFGENPSQGSIVGQRFIHPGGRFTFTVPQGYSLENSSNAVVGVAGDGEAVRFDSAEVPSDVSLVDYLRSGWIAGLEANSVRSVTHNGIEMATGTAQTDQWHFRVSVARLDGEVYRFIFAAKADSQRFAMGAESTLESFRRATPADLSGIKRVNITLVTASAGDTADSLARRMQGLNRGQELFYILNELYPGDPVTAGQQYKIVTVD